MQNTTTLSIVIPVYNEEDNLRQLHNEIEAAVAPMSRDYEILFVDDGSKDRSQSVIKDLAEQNPNVGYVIFEENQGQSAAFGAGFAHAKFDVVITMDADLQNDPADIPAMMELYEQGYDMVCGWRAKRKDTLVKRYSSKIANAIRTKMTGKTVTDTGCSLKIMRADMARQLPVFNGMHRFLPNMMMWHGARIAEVKVNHRARLHGVSKYGTFDRAVRGLYDLFGVRWLASRHVRYQVRESR